MAYLKEYDNKLKLVVNKMSGVMSVSIGIMVGAGSVNETPKNNGISHFLEHMSFKGTKTLSAFELSEAFDMIGASSNAYTSKENTCYYVKSTMQTAERAFELLSDLFLNSSYADEEIEKEKGVVLEEINMCEDTPEEVCLDNLSLAFFGNEGLGRTILGPEENVKAFDKKAIEEYRKDYYNADNVVISFSGNIEENEAERLVEKYFLPFVATNVSKPFFNTEKVNLAQDIRKYKDIEQNHLAFAFEGIKYYGKYHDELTLLNTIVGSGMSSRLFQRIREDLGLCYTIYSYPSGYRDVGSFVIYTGLNPDQTKEAYTAVLEVLKELKEKGITQNEFEKAKAQAISSFVFGQESTSSQMLLYARYLLMQGKLFDFEEKINKFESIKLEDVNELIRWFDFDKFSLSLVGRNVVDLKLQ